ncbi:putative ABC transport system permease protein [Streptohalobacillus salinus]|uniref:Putative ABC transport system permease protein n=1 Tax=Streptohalobacillus salinus TaxID=621096 RepID=A0A2V3W941_9BACI|nr:ABC transporter permease [Streptohalobacillus salinus]PXW90883.1 putative ABC transport system permease protein [Streptohalobacillus salinus]
MFISIFNAFESGIIFAIMALGVYLTFRILDFPDLTVDGSFVTGGAVTAILITNGMPAIIATFIAIVCGFIAGTITGLLNTKGKVNPLLSGILMMTALYSINLRIMGQSTIPLLNQSTVFTQLKNVFESAGLDGIINQGLTGLGLERTPSTYSVLLVMLVVTFFIKFVTDYFLKTEIGLALRATGDNERMIRSFSANTDFLTVIGLGFSNALVALAGGLYAQFTGFSDLNMGIGMIVVGLASVIIGESVVGTKSIMRTTFAVIIGSIIYRVVVTLALRADFLDNGDTRLITALLVILALVMPRLIETYKERTRKKKKRVALTEQIKEGA